MLTEASLLIDWFWPALHGKETPPAFAEEFEALWRPLLAEAEKADLGWVLRDYHSPNLMWLPEREGIKAGRHSRLSGRAAGPAGL